MKLKSINRDCILDVGNNLYKICDSHIRTYNLDMGIPFAAIHPDTNEIVGYFEFTEHVLDGWSTVYPVPFETAQALINSPASAKSLYLTIKRHMSRWARETNAKNFVVGISGGKDSTVVAMLLCTIFGKERVYGVMMPQGEQSDIQDSIDVCNILGIHQTTVNIGGSVAAITDEIYKNRSKSSIYPTKDMDINLPARIRMSTLHAIGQCVDGRVINTSNLSEDMVGYATQFGDNAGAYAPIQGLTVTEVKELGKYLIDVLGLNKTYNPFSPNLTETQCKEMSYKKRLIELIDKTPVDGLQSQSDEERLGFTYADLDKFIRLNEGSDEFKALIRKKYQQNKFKLEIVQMPQPDFSFLPNFVKD